MTDNKAISWAVAFLLLVIVASVFYMLMLMRGIHNEQARLQSVITSDIQNLNERVSTLEGNGEGAIASSSVPHGELVRVVKVIDGDTIELENGERLRYIGIDAPEKNDPRKPVQCFAQEATEKNRELVEGELIKFYKDVSERDKYQRLLGYVYREDGLFVNLELVRQGYAFSYPYSPDISKQDEFREVEREAREKERGLWSDCKIEETSSGRSQTNPL